jgi:hypothetical protein
VPRPRATLAAALGTLGVTSIVVLLAACAIGSEAATDDTGDSGKPPLTLDSSTPQPVEAGAHDAAATPDAADAAVADPCAEALAKITYDFESGAAGWTHATSDGATGSWPFDPWATGTASVGTACKAGKCFGTELTQNYAQCQRASLSSPAIDLSKCGGKTVALVFQHAYSFWTGSYGGSVWFDGGVVEVSGDGTTWAVPQGTYPGTVKINPDRTASYACVLPNGFGVHNKQGFVGAQSSTTKAELTLPSSAITATTRIRFSFASGVSSQTTNADSSRGSTAPGWRIDDVGFVMK